MPDHDLNPLLESGIAALKGYDPHDGLRAPHLYNALSLLHGLLGNDSWVGLYLFDGHNLVLGPFQGTPACEIIAPGRGVVGHCFQERTIVAVTDVRTIPDYICCDEKAQSEICVPLWKGKEIVGVLDVDLPYRHSYMKERKNWESLAKIIQSLLA